MNYAITAVSILIIVILGYKLWKSDNRLKLYSPIIHAEDEAKWMIIEATIEAKDIINNARTIAQKSVTKAIAIKAAYKQIEANTAKLQMQYEYKKKAYDDMTKQIHGLNAPTSD